ncbi:hypothetical protein BCY84_20424 [Trypanosoma cruzi cruzi]|nr:hypothetical protein TcBrA4_0047190 [Trypanosoma cruzi]PBJ69097.1 hypothetical protein BCY84_20424 [Trypanosoma cruzi cruzi]
MMGGIFFVSPVHAQCNGLLAVNNEDYAILGGLLGGLFLVAAYVLTLKLIDICYLQQNCRRVACEEDPSASGQMRQMTQTQPAWHPSVSRQSLPGSAGDGTAWSPYFSTQRRVHFNTDVVDHERSPIAFRSRDISQNARQTAEEPSVDVSRRDTNNETEWSYARGGMYEEVFSPPPTAPPR